jgi:hypothetical protein
MSQFMQRFQSWPYRALLAVVGLFMVGRQAAANTYSCKSTTNKCPNDASCDGATVDRDGCTVQCYNYATNEETKQEELAEAGSANCAKDSGSGS